MTLLGGIILPIVIARMLGVEALGIFSTASALGLLITTIIDWGYETRTPLLVRAAEHHYLAVHRIITTIHIAKTVLWCALMLVCGVVWLVWMPPRTLDSTVLTCVLYCLWALARGIMATYAAALRGLERFRIIAIVENSCSLAMYALMVGILLGTQNLALALVCLPLAEGAKILVFQQYLRTRVFDAAHHAEQKELSSAEEHTNYLQSIFQSLRGQMAFVLIQALSIVESRAGLFALAWFAVSPLDVGYFGAAMRFIIALRTFAGAVFNVLLPSFTQQIQTPTRGFLGQVFLVSGGIACVGSAVLCFAAEPLLYWIYGKDLIPATTVLRTVAPLFALQTVAHVWEAFLLARRQEWRVVGMLAFALVVFGCCLAVLSHFTFAVNAQNAATSVLVLACTIVVVYSVQSAWMLQRRTDVHA